jgi:hypothetical protein
MATLVGLSCQFMTNYTEFDQLHHVLVSRHEQGHTRCTRIQEPPEKVTATSVLSKSGNGTGCTN